MDNFRDLVKTSNKTWEWNPTLRTEFRLAKEEIIRRVKNGVKYYESRNSHVFPLTGAKWASE